MRQFIYKKLPYVSQKISHKLLISILLVSSVITLLLTALQLYFNFRYEISEIEMQLQQVEKGFLASITESVWDMDTRRLQTQLKGLTELPAINQLNVLDPQNRVILAVGEVTGNNFITRDYDLVLTRNNRQHALGSLHITASLEDAYVYLRKQILVILLSQALKTFLVSGFILFIVNQLIMRHLSTMARYAKELNMNHLDTPLVLDTDDDSAQDELSRVAQAINTMRENFLDDISRRQKIEQELEHLHEYLQDIFNSIPSAMIAINPECQVVRWNSEAENITGLNAREAEGCDVAHALPLLKTEMGTIRKTMQDRKLRKDIQLSSSKDGKPDYREVTLFPLIKNGVSGAVIRIDDITEKKLLALEKAKLEDKLAQSQKLEAIGTLAGGIAHDFNNILTSILGYGELLQRILPADSKALRYQNKVMQAGNRAKELVKQILAFSRKTEQKRIPMDMSTMLQEVLKLLRPAIPTTIAIKHDIDKQCGSILADPIQIHQLIMNLCTNAYHAMREKGGELAVTVKSIKIDQDDSKVLNMQLSPGAHVKLEISDTGCGMDHSTLARIFDPYFTTKSEGEGTGLGLSVVHGIVKSHKGYISANSEPGKGTSFHVYFPEIDQYQATRPTEIAADQPCGGNERILIVDDQLDIVQMLEISLQSLGYRVTSFSDSIEAFETLTIHPDTFDLIITDMTMPDMTGVELAQRILQQKPDMPIILCTGFSELITPEKAKEIGIRECLTKPVAFNDIAKVIRTVLDKAE